MGDEPRLLPAAAEVHCIKMAMGLHHGKAAGRSYNESEAFWGHCP
jgi:hypothetical protein